MSSAYNNKNKAPDSKKNNKNAVLDTSALMALFYNEEGADQVSELLDQSCLSVLTLCEILDQLHQKGGSVKEMEAQLKKLDLDIRLFDEEQACLATDLLSQSTGRRISFFDRAAIALAIALQLPLYTRQHAWIDLKLPIQIIAL
ncbi:MAG: PIN domain-containing protein [Gammaproteobacteria bacterium]|nr:PIN domain-containing protein [Gammaproteobacteria bacterium]